MSAEQSVRKPQEVLGVFIERTGGYLLRSRATPMADDNWSIEYLEDETVEWHPANKNSVDSGLSLLGALVSYYRNEVTSVAVASYGPFESLSPGPKYGKIRRNRADAPLAGYDICELFQRFLGRDWLEKSDTRFQVQTDASACAVGEAHRLGTGQDHVLAYLFATKGIGLGFVQGRKILANALHPEVGLLTALPHLRDKEAIQFGTSPIPINHRSPLAFQSISALAKEETLVSRYNKMRHHSDQEFKFKNKNDEDLFWNIRACYLAEACVACTVVHPPHSIVIGVDIDPLGDAPERVWNYFSNFRTGWSKSEEPYFDYEELQEGFISAPRPIEINGQRKPAPPKASGAIGLCYLAAASTAESKDYSSRPKYEINHG